MKSALFHTEQYKQVEERIREFLNQHEDFLSGHTARSTRAAGDAIQGILSEHFEGILGRDLCSRYSASFARRSMADLAFEDKDGCYYVVDVKTHRKSTQFNMPNLTSVERLARFYEDDRNFYVILMVTYDVAGIRAAISEVGFVPIEFLGWNCLTIGALGWGQVQIANSNMITVTPGYSRRKWMLELCDTMLEFYPREIVKIGKRIEYFKTVKQRWEREPD